jgi:hypothetical protein
MGQVYERLDQRCHFDNDNNNSNVLWCPHATTLAWHGFKLRQGQQYDKGNNYPGFVVGTYAVDKLPLWPAVKLPQVGCWFQQLPKLAPIAVEYMS